VNPDSDLARAQVSAVRFATLIFATAVQSTSGSWRCRLNSVAIRNV
jgi:hypothetical protein